MKKWILFTIVIVLLSAAALPVWAAAEQNECMTQSQSGVCEPSCTVLADENSDGRCDEICAETKETGSCVMNCADTNCSGICGNSHENCMDADCDGICDNRKDCNTDQQCPSGRNFTDSDNDGVCDNREDCNTDQQSGCTKAASSAAGNGRHHAGSGSGHHRQHGHGRK